jgi:transcription-repair coupling factor (superfamily II helicase)
MAETENSDGLFFNQFKQLRRYAGQIRPFIDDIRTLLQNNNEVVIVSRQSERIKEIWVEDVFYFEDLANASIKFIQGSLAEGFSFKSEQKGFYLFTDAEIFGWSRPQASHRPRVRSEAPEAEYIPFEENEFVVHIDHGIGKYVGLVKRQLNNSINEYLCVEYANNDQLFIPVYQADRLTKYVGSNDGSPKMTRLGGTDWNQVKVRVKKAVEEIAEDLLELYAKRNVVNAKAYGPDTQWQKEMEASFPFIETEDQLRVIKEVKKDLESTKPMDRLVCGDVGYGKTEVALRAAFKAVMEGKQVAFLVPTTILAQQHFKTFSQRLAGFPVNVEMLSRFRTEREQRSVLHAMAEGSVDIVIGTHRLVQNDINFKDLGLLIIDEEQRFGVSHKEHLKKMRTEVNVLTMTATPIPRTLYLTLTGIRDISTIQTAPEERLPIFTHVGAYSPKLVRQAILRELERGGQVFFVHNRVQTIRGVEMQLHNLIPEAKIAVVHGQMNEKELSKNMRMFADNEVDILLATSIIESGLDIPNANTLIVDRADTFGLAQLYQIKGRVGRGAQRAYAYFFRHPRKSPTEEGRQRLETLAENTQLGAGYSISMRDLEIRGAGDIIGTRQHGHISAVGFHLYTRLLSQAIKNLKIQENYIDAEIEEVFAPLVNVDLPILVNIPENYVSDENMRLRLYRRIADIRKVDEVEALHEEFEDRFGNLPNETENLLYQLKIKILAGSAEVESITAENGLIVLRFSEIDDNLKQRPFPVLPIHIRINRNSLRLSYLENSNWRNDLFNILSQQISFLNLGK